MYTEEDLESAMAAGVLPTEAVAGFRTFVATRRRSSAVDEEHVRLISGFNDIFVVIASVLLLASLAWIGSAAAPLLGAAFVAVGSWVLAEFFVRRRHMALPALMLLAAFVGAVFVTVLLGAGATTTRSPVGLTAAGVAAGLAAWAHWRRFKVPATVAAGLCALAVAVLSEVMIRLPAGSVWHAIIPFAAGLFVFTLALRWDASDPHRRTGRSDVAFWLHLLAAPLIVHPVFTQVGLFGAEAGPAQTVIVLLLYVGIAIVSLAIDRRALMVSALGYVLYAFATMLKQAGVVSLGFAITALVIGSALLILSAFWHRTRALAVGWLPRALQARVPPVDNLDAPANATTASEA